MGLLLILPILVSGYLLCLKDRVLFTRLHRHEGQLLYLLVAWQGVICFFLSCLIIFVASLLLGRTWSSGCLPALSSVCWGDFSLDFVAWGSGKLVEIDPSLKHRSGVWFFFLVAGLLTFVMPFVLAPLRLRWFRRRYKVNADKVEALASAKSVEHLPIPNALAASMFESTPVMITMADRKVYVGIVQSIGAPTEVTGVLEHFGFWPTISGYRDKDTLKVVYTYDYPDFDPETSVPIIFRQDNVVSVTEYDEAQEGRVLVRTETAEPPARQGSAPLTAFMGGVLVGWVVRGKK